MTKRIDLTGVIFGNWTVIYFDPIISKQRKASMYLCRCVCGIERYVRYDVLTSGRSTSCGCKRRKFIPVGNRFGALVILGPLLDNQGHSIDINGQRVAETRYKCQCDCGNISIHRYSSFTIHNIRSCGCLRKTRLRTHGLTGTTFYHTLKSNEYRERQKKLDVKWTIEKKTLLKRFIPFCVWCGRKNKLTVDHCLPLSRGFGLDIGNATILCRSCNSRKSNRNLESLPVGKSTLIVLTANLFAYYYEHPELHNQCLTLDSLLDQGVTLNIGDEVYPKIILYHY